MFFHFLLSIFGSMPDLQAFVKNCDQNDPVTLCEGHETKVCNTYDIYANKTLCDNVEPLSNNFYISGLLSTDSGYTSINDFYQISSINYSSSAKASDIKKLTKTNYNKELGDGDVRVFDMDGILLSRVNYDGYLDLSSVHPTNDGVFYFYSQSGKIYYKEYEKNEPEKSAV